MDSDDEFESCTEGEQVNVIKELEGGDDGYLIMTTEGKRLLHPDAFKQAVATGAAALPHPAAASSMGFVDMSEAAGLAQPQFRLSEDLNSIRLAASK